MPSTAPGRLRGGYIPKSCWKGPLSSGAYSVSWLAGGQSRSSSGCSGVGGSLRLGVFGNLVDRLRGWRICNSRSSHSRQENPQYISRAWNEVPTLRAISEAEGDILASFSLMIGLDRHRRRVTSEGRTFWTKPAARFERGLGLRKHVYAPNNDVARRAGRLGWWSKESFLLRHGVSFLDLHDLEHNSTGVSRG